MIAIRFVPRLLAFATLVLSVSFARAEFFFIGPSGGDFFDVLNWNDVADGTGVAPPVDSLPNSTSGAIAIDLVIDGATVEAAGQVDFGSGSLQLIGGGSLSISGSGNDIDFNSESSFTLNESTLIVDGDAVFEGTVSMTGGSVTAQTDDVEFQDALALTIDGTEFISGDNTVFDAFLAGSSIVNASFTAADRLGLRQNTTVVVTDSSIDVAGGTGDVDDVFAAAGDGSTLILEGASTLLADTVEEGVDLILRDTAIATLGGSGVEVLDNGSTATLESFESTLIVNEITNDPRDSIINGFSGLSYLADPSTWNVTDWDGVSAVSLQVIAIPEPASALLVTIGGLFVLNRRKTA